MDFGFRLAEEKIKEAINNGDLDNLPGKGKPQKVDDLSAIPEDLRTGYRIMKNAGMLPEEMEIKKEMVTLQDLIKQCDDEKQKQEYQKQLAEKNIRFQSLMEKRKISSSPSYRRYSGKINKRLGL